MIILADDGETLPQGLKETRRVKAEKKKGGAAIGRPWVKEIRG